MKSSHYLFFVCGLFVFASAFAQAASSTTTTPPEVGVTEHLGDIIPLNTPLIDENGKTVLLQSFIDKPVILNLVYYRCASICGPIMAGVASLIDRLQLVLGRDYRVVTISFNDQETFELAAKKKENFLKTIQKKVDPTQWSFLTGTPVSIKAITEATGFHYKKVDEDYLHPGVVMVLTPHGKISRYLYGTSFLTMDMTLALIEANQDRMGPSFKRAMLMCFSYDPKGRTYVFRVLPVFGALILFGIAVFGFVLFRRARKQPS